MSKRATYLMGAAAIAVGITLIVIAFTSASDDGGDDPPSAAEKRPSAPQAPQRQQTAPADRAGATGPAGNARAKSLSKAVSRGRRAPAPGFAVEVVEKGSPPAQARPLEEAVAGDSLALTRLRGSPVVLSVWSSDCGPCRADARLIETTWQRWGRRGVAFVGLSVGESADDAQKFADEYDLSYPIVRDAAGRVANAYGVTSLPETFFISGTGDIIGHVAGRPSVRQMELGDCGRAYRAGVRQRAGRQP